MAGYLAVDVPESAPEIVARLLKAGFELAVQLDRLRIRPAERVSPDLQALLGKRKPELLALLEPITEYVTLTGVLTVPLPALRLAWEFEDRGLNITLNQRGGVHVDPTTALTERDRIAIDRWSVNLAALVNYQPPEVT